MTVPPELNTRTGVLRLAEPTFAALLAHATGERGEPDTAEQLELLRSAEVLDEHARPHSALTPALDAIRAPSIATLELSYKGKAMRGWVGNEHAALLRPAGEDGRHMLMSVGVRTLPEALARLADLAPRPRPEPAAPVRYREGALNGVRRHWRLTAEWTSRYGARDGVALEVVDTDGGLWIVRPGEDGDPVAWPSTPTRVWRMIIRLLLHRSV